MKKFFKYLLLGLFLSLATIPVLADTESIIVALTSPQDKEQDDLPSKGNRKPFAHFVCTIDFNNLSLSTSVPDEIISFGLWYENGTYLIASYDSDSEFVNFLSGLSGAYQLRLVGEDHVYIGYIEL